MTPEQENLNKKLQEIEAFRKTRAKWYELDRWAQYSDLVIVVCFGFFVVGIVLLSHSLAVGLVVAGAGGMGLGYLMAKVS